MCVFLSNKCMPCSIMLVYDVFFFTITSCKLKEHNGIKLHQ